MSSKIVRLCLLLGAVVLLIALAAARALTAGDVTKEVTLGRLITDAQEDDIVAFLETLTDRVIVRIPIH
jgi:hypothetical protein